MDVVLEKLPNRSYDAVICRALKYNLKSFTYTNQLYKDEEIQFIIDNWKDYSDHYMAEKIGRTHRSVKFMRENLGLYRQDPNRQLSYVNLERYLRGNIYNWKLESMRKCNYQCVLTGSKDFAVHHLYSFNYILKLFAAENNIDICYDITHYSNLELENITTKFNEFHDSFPLGVCVNKELHKLFHHIYGKNINTPKQWDEFKSDYMKGKYNYQPA